MGESPADADAGRGPSDGKRACPRLICQPASFEVGDRAAFVTGIDFIDAAVVQRMDTLVPEIASRNQRHHILPDLRQNGAVPHEERNSIQWRVYRDRLPDRK